jgi:hypothetical protein
MNVNCDALIWLNNSYYNFAPLGIWVSNNCVSPNPFKLSDYSFNFCGENIFSTSNDEIF